ncbi:hypothetical protein DM02DRAFT_415978 [Periconia macrospinosa]|uniref:FAD-binding FR-type domain-containing protein n=1 Tax=Periconia macrospinosa TaxID=97972 RepID=A0A2V1DPB2_9PLEO|nr:hypothetical protein DM02DRAFT_415978 [Periconia macrospinosa]
MAPQLYLTDEEIKHFVDDLDHNNDGTIDYWELEKKLDDINRELAPKAEPHNLHHESRSDEAPRQFLRGLTNNRDKIPRAEFEECVRNWEIPSLEQDRKEAKEEDEYFKNISIWRRIRAYWAVKGPSILFMALVISIMLAFGIWQLVKYLTYEQYRPAFGPGVVVSKACAGVLYPTFFFILLSMSRWFATFLRRFYFISRFINWDLSQSFHIKMSIAGLVFATIHAIGHLTGSFVYGSKPGRQQNVAVVLGEDAIPRRYIDYVSSLPGWTGITSLGCFYLLALLSMPQIRKWSYEVFQLGHLLMYPIVGLMMAHGTQGLLQWPMFGYWLAFPTLLVVSERITRFSLGFFPLMTDLEILDEEAVVITCNIPKFRFWPYKAGQYVFVQVPEISFFQWHPFTVSTCTGNTMQVHIKADGDWTKALRKLASPGTRTTIKVGIDGPHGAPAQRFYDFEYSMVFGAGIGVTPFSGVLTDLQNHELERSLSGERSASASDGADDDNTRRASSNSQSLSEPSSSSPYKDHRRIDFHWMVRDRNNLLWFSDLLNQVSRAQELDSSHLDIRIHTYVTQKRKQISQHVFRWLLEKHRTLSHPKSPLTGLLNPTHFGRPELGVIMEEHYQDMCKELAQRTQGGREKKWDGMGDADEIKVGVFFCGPPVIGQQLADRCESMTARARNDGKKIEYYFMMEVFG